MDKPSPNTLWLSGIGLLAVLAILNGLDAKPNAGTSFMIIVVAILTMLLAYGKEKR